MTSGAPTGAEHTPRNDLLEADWTYGGAEDHGYINAGRYRIAEMSNPHNPDLVACAHRIVACHRACAGLADPERDVARLREERDDTAKALAECQKTHGSSYGVDWQQWRAASAEVERLQEWKREALLVFREVDEVVETIPHKAGQSKVRVVLAEVARLREERDALKVLRSAVNGSVDDDFDAAEVIAGLEQERDALHSLKCDIGNALGGDDPRPFVERIRDQRAEVSRLQEENAELARRVEQQRGALDAAARAEVEYTALRKENAGTKFELGCVKEDAELLAAERDALQARNARLVEAIGGLRAELGTIPTAARAVYTEARWEKLWECINAVDGALDAAKEKSDGS